MGIWDISNPLTPVRVSNFGGWEYTVDLAVRGNYVYLSYASGRIEIVDVSDPAAPLGMGTYDMGWHNHRIALNKNLLLQAHCIDAIILDISDPWNPSFVSRFDSAGFATTKGIAVYGNYAFTTHYLYWPGNPLKIWDISDPYMPNLVGEYLSSYFEANWNVKISGNYAYVVDLWKGLEVIDVSNPALPVLADSIINSNWGEDIFVLGSYLFMTRWALLAYDISNPYHIVCMGEYPNPSFSPFYDVCAADSLVYTISNDSLYIFLFRPQEVAVNELEHPPGALSLSPPYPNPFNAQTKIDLDLPEATDITLEIYDILGLRVSALVDGLVMAPGHHEFTWDANDFPSGIYFVRLRAGEYAETKKLMHLK